jgi:hypothetical protein
MSMNSTIAKTLRYLCAMAAAGLCAQGTLRAAESGGKLIEFDPAGTYKDPGFGSEALANNDEGAVVGYYVDANVVYHGFLRTPGGKITALDAPGGGTTVGQGQGTVPYSINDLGVIVGNVEDANDLYHGFVRQPDGKYEEFDVPGAGTAANQGTIPLSVNVEGTSTGYYVDASNGYHGFVRSVSGEVKTFDPPGSVFTFPCEETCINPEGEVVGYFVDANSLIHGFLREPNGQITVLDAPFAGAGANQGTIAASVNPFGEVTGYIADAQNKYHGFTRSADGVFHLFDVPQSQPLPAGTGTVAFAISLVGATTGIFIDAKSVDHGFLRSPGGEVVRFDAPDAGKDAQQGTRPSTNNFDGEVAGWYIDSGNVTHSFVWIPDCPWK